MELTKAQLAEKLQQAVHQRDAQWSSRVLGISEVLTPSKAAAWLQKDRVSRAREVAEAARFKGSPKHY